MENEAIINYFYWQPEQNIYHVGCLLAVVGGRRGGRDDTWQGLALVFTPEYVSSCWGCWDHTVIIWLWMTQYLLGWRQGRKGPGREEGGGGGRRYLVKCCVYNSTTNWSREILEGTGSNWRLLTFLPNWVYIKPTAQRSHKQLCIKSPSLSPFLSRLCDAISNVCPPEPFSLLGYSSYFSQLMGLLLRWAVVVELSSSAG